ncbi:uncharacterized protein KD926_000349 [Aspergillus affinis]|uniref:uncharacterized protein n=1 Tax=Aspergillus affinis TaxID=1070780 RepID=UPI0022FED20A|nr:uncharacterized protein KD926_000349 [Aspergillus affinis]KAI9037470.1 hypothetical protein KD926_000349 [Aspergillus affinis]
MAVRGEDDHPSALHCGIKNPWQPLVVSSLVQGVRSLVRPQLEYSSFSSRDLRHTGNQPNSVQQIDLIRNPESATDPVRIKLVLVTFILDEFVIDACYSEIWNDIQNELRLGLGGYSIGYFG